MQKIIPHLWFDKEALEAAQFYASIFPRSKVKSITELHNTPSGTVDVVTFELLGQSFMALSAGPLFTFNPSVSFLVVCKSKDEVDAYWEKLSEGGKVLMEIGDYPFSKRYGWTEDKYGLSWQIIVMDDPQMKQMIVPTLMFVGEQAGKSEEAMNFYVSIFHDSKIDHILRYEKNELPEKEGTVKHAAFTLEGQNFAAMDSAQEHGFAFNEAISFMVNCETQEEINYYWDKLSAVPEAEQCGWLKDKYGLSWQIVPIGMEEMLQNPDREKVERVTEAFLKMKKFVISELQKAFDKM